jgi:hypothetical protein
LVAAVPRVVAATQGLFADELFTFVIAQHDSLGDVLAGVNDTENTPPLYYVLAWLASKAGDDPELVRLPALLCGIATVPAIGLLGRRAFGDAAGLVAAALVAASPFAVHYSSEARAYAPVALAVALAGLALLQALQTGKRAWWAALALSVLVALWLQYIALLPLAAQAGWALFARPDRRRPLLLAHAAALAFYLPWLPFAGQNAPLPGMFKPYQLVDFPLRTLLGWPNADVAEVPGMLMVTAFGLVLAGVAAAAVRARPSPRFAEPGAMLATAALATPAGLLAYSAVGDGVFVARNLIVSVPAGVVLLAGLIARRSAAIALPAAAAAVALLVPTAARVAFGDLRRPPYDEVAGYLDRRAGPLDVIVDEPAGRLAKAEREELGAFLRRPHVRLYGPEGAAAGWRSGLRGARVFWLYTQESVPPADMVDRRFAPVARRFWPRRNGGLVLVEYAPHERARGG